MYLELGLVRALDKWRHVASFELLPVGLHLATQEGTLVGHMLQVALTELMQDFDGIVLGEFFQSIHSALIQIRLGQLTCDTQTTLQLFKCTICTRSPFKPRWFPWHYNFLCQAATAKLKHDPTNYQRII